MKVGIITYFNIKNYGSALQALAMREFLEKNGYNAEFISVKECQSVDKLLHKIHVATVTIAKCLIYKEARKTQQEIMRLKRETLSVMTKDSNKKFILFAKDFIPSKCIGRRMLKKVALTDEYGAFICGSDQIWSPLSPHLSRFKFLNFAPRYKRIAYAPSFGVSKISSYNKAFVKKMLSGIDDISVREFDGAKIIKSLIERDVPVLLDPTMLLSGEEWRNLYKNNIPNNKCDKYVLCYFFDEPKPEIISKITEFAFTRNLKIKVLFSSNVSFVKNGAECVDAGPWEFLQLVDNAQYVFTNSFHGCAFSILFKKEFIAFGRKHSEAVKQTSRIATLLEQVGATQSFCSDNNTDFHFPVTNNFESAIAELRKISSKYLLDCLKKRKEVRNEYISY
jgi:hypothetical protein